MDGGALLDVGSRDGVLSKYLKPEITYTAIDNVQSNIDIMRSEGVDAFLANAEQLPFKDGAFDVAIMAEVIEHLLNPGLCLKEVHRVLNRRGNLIASVPNAEFLSRVFHVVQNVLTFKRKKLKRHNTHSLGGHVYMFNKNHLDLLLRSCGFVPSTWKGNITEKFIIVVANKRSGD